MPNREGGQKTRQPETGFSQVRNGSAPSSTSHHGAFAHNLTGTRCTARFLKETRHKQRLRTSLIRCLSSDNGEGCACCRSLDDRHDAYSQTDTFSNNAFEKTLFACVRTWSVFSLHTVLLDSSWWHRWARGLNRQSCEPCDLPRGPRGPWRRNQTVLSVTDGDRFVEKWHAVLVRVHHCCPVQPWTDLPSERVCALGKPANEWHMGVQGLRAIARRVQANVLRVPFFACVHELVVSITEWRMYLNE